MSEVKLRLAVRDLYRGDGGRLSSYDEGWNDGVDAAVKVLYVAPNIDEMSSTPRVDAKVFNFLNAPPSMNMNQDVVRADFARDLERENERLREALQVCDLALSKVSDGGTSNEFRKVYADALRDAGVAK